MLQPGEGVRPSTLTTALEWRACGASVIPAQMVGDKAKSPAIAWKKNQTQPADEEQINSWFENLGYGLGIVTGAVSGNLEMLELEKRAVDKNFQNVIAELAQNSGLGELWNRINSGYCEESRSGGLHWIYKISDHAVPGNTKFAVDANREVIAETRGEGGFVVVAPSIIQSTGKGWTQLRGGPSSIATISWEERNSIVVLFKTLDQTPKVEAVASKPASSSSGLLPGDDFKAKTTWQEILVPSGWKFIFTDSAGSSYWRRPGKDEGISATTGFGGSDFLYVFTTSTTFKAEQAYSKFAAYAHLKHGNDFKAAATSLREQGYGQPLVPTNVSSLLLSKSALDTQPHVTGDVSEEIESTWKPVDLTEHIYGTYIPLLPTLLRRKDGVCLFYKGLVHSIYGESESGKSWIAQFAVTELIKNDQKVIYIDFESDPGSIVDRLKILGLPAEKLIKYFTYIRPERAFDVSDSYWKNILEPGSAELVIIDGVTESLALWGGSTKDNDEITRWMKIFPAAVASKSGATVILIDHVIKNASTAGRFAIGAQAKLATIDGCAYLVEPIEGIAPGGVGKLSMKITKDRPGQVRKHSGKLNSADRTQEAAIITVDSSTDQMKYEICAPMSDAEALESRERTVGLGIALFLFKNPGANKGFVTKNVKGRDQVISEQLASMLKNGYISDTGKGRASALSLTEAGEKEYPVRFVSTSPVGDPVSHKPLAHPNGQTI